jgi:hypothetical protein
MMRIRLDQLQAAFEHRNREPSQAADVLQDMDFDTEAEARAFGGSLLTP